MYGLMNRPRRRGARRRVDTEDDGGTITPFYAAAIINAAIPRISSRSTRNTKPRCLHLAPSKTEFEFKYPKHLFCCNCESLYQKLVVEGGRKASPDSRRFQCIATHDNFIYPTHLKPIHHSMINILDDDDDMSDMGSELDYGVDDDDDDDGNNNNNNNNNNNSNSNNNSNNKSPKTPTMKKRISDLKLSVETKSKKVKEMDQELEMNYDNVHEIIESFKARISVLQLQLKEKDLELEKSKDCIIKLRQLSYEKNNNLSASISSSISYEQQHNKNNLNNKKLLMTRLINLHSKKKTKFHDFSMLTNDCNTNKEMRLIMFVDNMLINPDGLFDGMLFKIVLQRVNKYYREHIFSPYKLLKRMDETNHVLSLSAVELLRGMLELEKGSQHNLFPSSTNIQKIGALVSARGKLAVPYTLDYLSNALGGGERVTWNDTATLSLLLKASGLNEQAKREHVNIGSGMDGMKLWNGATLVVRGLKNHSPHAHSPITKTPNLSVDADGTISSFSQSPENQIIISMMIAKETTQLLQAEFAPQSKLYQEETQAAVNHKTSILLGSFYMALKMVAESDLSAHWKMLLHGGAAKVANKPCTCCNIHNRDLLSYSTNYADCKWCTQLIWDGLITPEEVQQKSFHCIHHKLLSSDLLPAITQKLNILKSKLPEEYVPATEPALLPPNDYDNPTTIDITDTNSISFNLTHDSVTPAIKSNYFSSLLGDLLQRHIPVSPNETVTEDLQLKLLSVMRIEKDIITTEGEVQFINDNLQRGAYRTEWACPCVLHLEMRVALKLITLLVREGLKRALLRCDSRHALSTATAYVQKVETVLQTEILGKLHRPHSYSVPFDPQKKIITDFNLNNGPCRKILRQFNLLVDTCLIDNVGNDNIDDSDNNNGLSMHEERELWKKAIEYYKQGQEIMLSKTDLADLEIRRMQGQFDLFSQIMIYSLGFELAFITNYTHMISSSHMAEYAMRVRCLYRHSQQGFEGVVGQLKKFVFRRTNRGGGRGTGNRLVGLTHHRSRLFAYMLDETLVEMRNKLREEHVEEVSEESDILLTVPTDQTTMTLPLMMCV